MEVKKESLSSVAANIINLNYDLKKDKYKKAQRQQIINIKFFGLDLD